jgi:hypothetical protein
MNFNITAIILLVVLSCTTEIDNNLVTTEKLINELTDLERLTTLPLYNYKSIQYSSYDRRSTSPSDSCWFSNEDGFGEEPIPGFETVLKQPDSSGIGEYLICDISKPGAIMRLWTANINGRIRLYLDNTKTPVFEGDAEDFFWKSIEMLGGKAPDFDYRNTLRQYDATYFPIPFSKRCRIEWIGDLRKIHFYHVGLRIYDNDVKVKTFSPDDVSQYLLTLKEINTKLAESGGDQDIIDIPAKSLRVMVPPGQQRSIFEEKGQGAVRYLSIKINASDTESALRKNVLSIWFDDSSVPQVHAPVGDFFGAAPGINPYASLPFTVQPDGSMICRFVMPYKRSVRIGIENLSDEESAAEVGVRTEDYDWVEGRSMHFRARWKTDNGLTASYFSPHSSNVFDVPYLMVSGQGRIVGAAAYIYNPSNATTSWGNWWGEGDEKIFVDNDSFPSFFGTGSEDYFNYSWSSSRIFSYPYCGQPRNDGPGNRGYVSNYRWHISDDIPFSKKTAFYMELGHHGVVKDFSYGRIVYFYTLPGALDDFRRISADDIGTIPYKTWSPIAYLGSAGYRYIQAEDVINQSPDIKAESGKMWAEDKILIWSPSSVRNKLSFNLNCENSRKNTNIAFTFCHTHSGGTISVTLNGKPVKMDGKTEIDLYEPYQTILVNHFSEKIDLKKGSNEIVIESKTTGKTSKVGIDFIWMRED